MLAEEFQKQILEINSQFLQYQTEKYNVKATNGSLSEEFKSATQTSVEMLHSLLVGAKQMLTKEEQKKIPELLKFTYSRLGREILKCCGEEYKNAFSLSLREEKNQVDSVEI